MEFLIIVLLLASLLGVWILSVRRRLEAQENNIQNAMNQIQVHLTAEREALSALEELLEQMPETGTRQGGKQKQRSEMGRNDQGELQPEGAARQQKELLRLQGEIGNLSEQMPLLQAQETYQKYWKAAKSYAHMVETSSLIYNDSVECYNHAIGKLPNRIAAWVCGFRPRKTIDIM